MEVIILFVVVFCIFGAFVGKPKPIPPKPIPVVAAKKKKVGKVKPQVDPAWNSAKSNLVLMGYSATEAKKMLDGLKCSTPEQYINQAMKRVKI